MNNAAPLVLTTLHPGRDLTHADIERLADRVSKIGSPRPLVFEVWATSSGVSHYVGRKANDSSAVRLLLTTQLPGARLSKGDRPAVPETILRLSLSSRILPLAEKAEEAALFSLHAAFQSVRGSENLAVQVVIGSGRSPQRTAPHLPDPSQTLLGLLLNGEQPASSDAQRRIVQHRAASRLDVTVRIGVTAAVPERRKVLLHQLLGALSQLESPGVRFATSHEASAKWMSGAPGWAPLTLTGSQLLPFLAWPLSGVYLPGQPDEHPRLLASPSPLYKVGAQIATTNLPGSAQPVRLSTEARSQHLAITGGTGSGKSTMLAHLCLDDIRNQRASLLIDPKRQLVDHILERAPKDAAGRIVVIDAADPEPVGLNPLDVGDRDPDVVVDGILAVFKQVFADGWGPRTEDLMHAGLLTLAQSGQARGEPHTLLDLPKLLSSDAYRRSVVGRIQDDPVLATFWATFENLSPAHRASIIAAPMNKLRKYVLRKNVAAVLGQSRPRFRLRDIFRERKTVLVPLNDALVGPGAAQLLGGLVVAEAWLATMERANEADPSKRPAAIYVDEVQRYMHLPTSIEDALATSRSYGVAWVLAFQGRSQVSKSFALAVELNARNKITFAASPHDARELAKSAPNLTPDDFQALRPFEIYANLVAGGAPAGWLSATSLSPTAPLGHQNAIRRANTALFGGVPDLPSASPDTTEIEPKADPGALTHQRKRRA